MRVNERQPVRRSVASTSATATSGSLLPVKVWWLQESARDNWQEGMAVKMVVVVGQPTDAMIAAGCRNRRPKMQSQRGGRDGVQTSGTKQSLFLRVRV